MKTRGFTLVEMLVVIIILGILAGILTVFLRPAIVSYIDTRRRADLSDIADTALRRIGQDVRNAVPNSVRMGSSASCIQLVPTLNGGRYRMDIDNVNPGEAALDTGAATSQFDVLSPMNMTPTSTPAIGDWVVINNQNGVDVYNGDNRSAITAIATPAANIGQHRLSITPKQFSPGYNGGRFTIVSNATQTVFYNRVGTTLYRTPAAFNATAAASCASTAGAILATDVSGLTFVYTPNQGATQQSGFVWMRIELSRGGDTVAFNHGVHVSNVP